MYAPLQSARTPRRWHSRRRDSQAWTRGGVLDAPCGFGRHSIALAHAGFNVTGADRSHVLLDEARQSRGRTQLDWIQADYRELAVPGLLVRRRFQPLHLAGLRRQGGRRAGSARVPARPASRRSPRRRDDAPRPPGAHFLAADLGPPPDWIRARGAELRPGRWGDPRELHLRPELRRAVRVPVHDPRLCAFRASRDGACSRVRER